MLSFRRADVQNGATSGASGSTSAVLSPLLPAIFGIAFENGSLTRTVSGSTITLKANPAGLFCASGEDAARVARRDDSCRTFWNRVGLTASFDTSRGEKKAGLENLKALNSQFTELSVRVELINHRKATGERFQKVFRKEIADWQARAQLFANRNVLTSKKFPSSRTTSSQTAPRPLGTNRSALKLIDTGHKVITAYERLATVISG